MMHLLSAVLSAVAALDINAKMHEGVSGHQYVDGLYGKWH